MELLYIHVAYISCLGPAAAYAVCEIQKKNGAQAAPAERNTAAEYEVLIVLLIFRTDLKSAGRSSSLH
jgi:hypothetical protein